MKKYLFLLKSFSAFNEMAFSVFIFWIILKNIYYVEPFMQHLDEVNLIIVDNLSDMFFKFNLEVFY